MTPITSGDPLSQSADLIGTNLARLQALFPEAFSEGRINFDVLRQLLGGAVDDRPEKYGLNWHGKRLARQHALTPSTSTLRPARGDSVDWDTTQNLMIEGDNLEVLKLLQKGYSGKVKLIYIDPPYNTGSDFVYKDDFRDPIGNYKRETGQTDENGRATSSNTEASGRFHTNWLNMMYPRLFLARQLLRDDGVICVSIDDHEAHHLRLLMNEVFGEENFVATAVWQKAYTSNMTAKHVSDTHDYIVIYARDAERTTVGRLKRTQEQIDKFTNPDGDKRGPWKAENLSAGKFYAAGQFEIETPAGKKVKPPPGRYWRCNEAQYKKWLEEGRITFGKGGQGRPMLKNYLNEAGDLTPNTWWTHQECGSNKEASIELKQLFDGDAVFDTPKPLKLLDRLITLFTDPDALVLDFFAGSAVTAETVLRADRSEPSGRKFISIQIPERTGNKQYATIAEIGKERIRRVITKLQKENTGLLASALGFRVYKLDTSNIRSWEPDRDNLSGSLLGYTDHIVEDRTEDDILTELLLKLGLNLCVPVEKKTIAEKTVHSVGGVLLVCLAETITAKEADPLARGIADWHKELSGVGESVVVFRDSAFDGDDVAKTNLTESLKQRGLTHVRSI